LKCSLACRLKSTGGAFKDAAREKYYDGMEPLVLVNNAPFVDELAVVQFVLHINRPQNFVSFLLGKAHLWSDPHP